MSSEVKAEKGSFRDYDGEEWSLIYFPNGDDFRLVLGEETGDETEIDCIPVSALKQLQAALNKAFRERKVRRPRRGDPDRNV